MPSLSKFLCPNNGFHKPVLTLHPEFLYCSPIFSVLRFQTEENFKNSSFFTFFSCWKFFFMKILIWNVWSSLGAQWVKNPALSLSDSGSIPGPRTPACSVGNIYVYIFFSPLYPFLLSYFTNSSLFYTGSFNPLIIEIIP